MTTDAKPKILVAALTGWWDTFDVLRFRLAVATLSVAVWASATAATAASSTTPVKPAPASPATKAPQPHPMVFFLAKGEPDACGSGCSEWIAADGQFDFDAPDRFQTFLKRLGGRTLPVYFRTPGG